MTDQQDVATARGKPSRVEGPVTQLGRRLRLDPEAPTRQLRGVGGTDLRARQAGIDPCAERGEGPARRFGLPLALLGQAPCGVVACALLGVAVPQQVGVQRG